MIQKESQNKFEIKMGIDDLDPNDRQNAINTDDKQTEKGLNHVTSCTTKNAPNLNDEQHKHSSIANTVTNNR